MLGNHDLHLLARAEGVAAPRRRDTLDEVLAARDARRPARLAARPPAAPSRGRVDDGARRAAAGVDPAEAEKLARDTAERLRGKSGRRLLATFRDAPPGRFRETLSPAARRRLALAAFSRLRTLTAGAA